MGRPIQVLEIIFNQRRVLRQAVNRPAVPYRDNRRAWIILNRADGMSQKETAQKVR